MLREVAGALCRALRPQDRLFRIGGDEFAALVDVRDAARAVEVGQRLNAAARREAGTTVSVGIAVPRPGESDTALLARADRALYAVKRAGGDAEQLA
jgi:diguanylate cyclase (GGDEF)-like protein